MEKSESIKRFEELQGKLDDLKSEKIKEETELSHIKKEMEELGLKLKQEFNIDLDKLGEFKERTDKRIGELETEVEEIYSKVDEK